MTPDQDALARALEECAREPVHIPNAIQSHGALVSVDPAFSRIHQVSANIEDFLGVTPDQALGMSPELLFGIRPVAVMKAAVVRGKQYFTRNVRRQLPAGTRYLLISGYQSTADRVVLELEPLRRGGSTRMMGLLNHWLDLLISAQNQDALLQSLTETVRDVTRCDRVLVFQFDPNWHGHVLAESRNERMQSFLDHRFPASDIPSQVRALYDINPLRSIVDARQESVPLVPERDPYVADPLDMSLGALRAVSPVHRQYMHNMGIAASMSVAIHREEKLWGLLSCHGREPALFSPAARETTRALVEVAAQRLFRLGARSDAAFMRKIEQSRESFASREPRRSAVDLLKRHGPEWMKLFKVCGMALVHGDTVAGVGDRPRDGELRKLAHWVVGRHEESSRCWSTDRLLEELADAEVDVGEMCGLLAVPMFVDEPRNAWFMMFRDEEVKSLRWAGSPHEKATVESGQPRLDPRHSFDTWLEEVRGRGARWETAQIRAALALAEHLSVTLSVGRIAQLNEELENTNRKLREMAQTDSLTQLWNRYRMEQEIDEELAAAERYGRPCAVLLFDVDHFKAVNDTWGHDAGDRVLAGIAGRARSLLRETDHLGRWGGEEFVLLAGNTPAEDAPVVAERIRQEIAASELPPAGRVTISVGVACCQPGERRRALVARADAALYQAKHEGRNRVAMA